MLCKLETRIPVTSWCLVLSNCVLLKGRHTHFLLWCSIESVDLCGRLLARNRKYPTWPFPLPTTTRENPLVARDEIADSQSGTPFGEILRNFLRLLWQRPFSVLLVRVFAPIGNVVCAASLPYEANVMTKSSPRKRQKERNFATQCDKAFSPFWRYAPTKTRPDKDRLSNHEWTVMS